jgi:integrase
VDQKPVKPYPSFPLTPHAKGWFVRHGGKPRFVCGRVSPEDAIVAWDRKKKVWDAADAAAVTAAPPPPADPGRVDVGDLAEQFLASVEARAGEGRIIKRSFGEYVEAVRDFCGVVGADTRVSDLLPPHFLRHRVYLSGRFGVHRLKKYMIAVRTMMKWGADNGVVDRPPRYGTEYKLPTKRDSRLARAAREAAFGPLLFTAAEVGALLAACDGVNMRAMLLLALNGGYGNEDVADLQTVVLDLDRGVAQYRRGKTGVRRRVLLWAETVDAVRAALDARPRPAAPGLANHVLLTRFGNRYIEETEGGKHKDQIGMQFKALCVRAGVYQERRGFYALRHTFRTLADETGDQRATALIMGHEVGDVADLYVERISDARLAAVVGHVRGAILEPALKVEREVRAAREGKEKPAGEVPELNDAA